VHALIVVQEMSWILIIAVFAFPIYLARRLTGALRVIVVVLLILAFTPAHNGLFSWLLNSRWELVRDSPVVRVWFVSATQGDRHVIGFNHLLMGPSEARYIDTGEHFWEEGL
jgi:hypothetical protein